MNTFAAPAQVDDSAPRGLEVRCLKPLPRPLSRVQVGRVVRIKELFTPPLVTQRLREIGLGEQQVIKLLVRQSNLICLVCNARLAVSSQLASMIIVEPLAV
jgi:Fe2+ transport system protein FeoA